MRFDKIFKQDSADIFIMKVLVIGDMHGRFPARIKKAAKSKEIDFIIALGDYANANKIRKLIFKYWTNKHWYEVVGMEKAEQIERESFNSGLKVLKELNNLGKPVFLIWGNTDFYREYRKTDHQPLMPGFYEDQIKKMKNLIILDNHKKTIKNLGLVGFGGYIDPTEYIKHPIDKDKKKQAERLKNYNLDEKRLKKLFMKNKNLRNFIFAIHYPPIGAFDIVRFVKKSPMYGKSAGWKPYNEVIRKYKPKLVLCGHMHEYQGKKRLGNSVVVNPGEGSQGKFAVIDTESLKVKFFR